MPLELTPISYPDLNARQKENYNFLKVSAVLADYGFMTMRLTDDWKGADFIAQHIDGETLLRIQLKGRLSFSKKYMRKNLYVAFNHQDIWFLYLHDELLETILKETGIGSTESWTNDGEYHRAPPSTQMLEMLEPYRISSPKKTP